MLHLKDLDCTKIVHNAALGVREKVAPSRLCFL